MTKDYTFQVRLTEYERNLIKLLRLTLSRQLDLSLSDSDVIRMLIRKRAQDEGIFNPGVLDPNGEGEEVPA